MDAGAQDPCSTGVLAGYPLVNLKVTLLDGQYHDVDSSEMAFKIAGSQALKKAAAAEPGSWSRWPSRPSRPGGRR